jgi:hypothetical protein
MTSACPSPPRSGSPSVSGLGLPPGLAVLLAVLALAGLTASIDAQAD